MHYGRAKAMMHNKLICRPRMQPSKMLMMKWKVMASICLRGWTWFIMTESRASRRCLHFLKTSLDIMRRPPSTELESDIIYCAIPKSSSSRMIPLRKFQTAAYLTLWALNWVTPHKQARGRPSLASDNTTESNIWWKLGGKLSRSSTHSIWTWTRFANFLD